MGATSLKRFGLIALATALVGVPLTTGFAIYAMVRLTRMAGLGGAAARIAGLARAMRAHAAPLPLDPEVRRAELLDTCGTGGARAFG